MYTGRAFLDSGGPSRYLPRFRFELLTRANARQKGYLMKIRNSLKSAKLRDKNCRVVRRRGRVYVINKKNPRMKARQG